MVIDCWLMIFAQVFTPRTAAIAFSFADFDKVVMTSMEVQVETV